MGEQSPAHMGEAMGKGRTREGVGSLSSSSSGIRRDKCEVLGLLWLRFLLMGFSFPGDLKSQELLGVTSWCKVCFWMRVKDSGLRML